MQGTVLWTMNEWYAVDVDGAEWRCRLRGSMRKDGRGAVLPVIGDQVEVQPTGEGEGMVEAVESRRSTFSRKAAGAKGAWREQVLAANVDQVLVVFAIASPEPHLRAVDRFLLVAEASELPVELIVNKIDLTGVETARSVFGVYERAGYTVRYVSAVERHGLDGLRDLLAGRLTLVAGPSGVGKSSLINTVVGLDLRTGEISTALKKGRHTTVVGALHALPGGGYVADTPGLRELAPWDLPSEELADCFPEMRPFQDECRWQPCLHRNEQGCAVREAVGQGAIDPARYDSYLRILDDALEAERLAARAPRAR
jgi:ribosome biogenesis GTPase / thiamine phosphate phosphatase